jgi:hypothetical protein
MEHAPVTPPKTFTLSDANALLPEVRRLAEELQVLQRSILQASEQRDDLARKLAAGNGYPVQTLKAQMEETALRQLKLIEEIQRILRALEALGAVVKDLATGLMDFYSVRNDELVFLCWKLGEDRIRFWHSLDEGFAGRRPLD